DQRDLGADVLAAAGRDLRPPHALVVGQHGCGADGLRRAERQADLILASRARHARRGLRPADAVHRVVAPDPRGLEPYIERGEVAVIGVAGPAVPPVVREPYL